MRSRLNRDLSARIVTRTIRWLARALAPPHVSSVMTVQRFPTTGLLVGMAAVAAAVFATPAASQFGREPTACMEIATSYAARLADLGELAPLVETQSRALVALDEISTRDGMEPFDRLEEARALMRGRDLWDASRDIRRVTRLIDNSSSVVAGWRGLYCPSAVPTGAANLEGQQRCDALSAMFVDRLRIDNPSPQEIRERERRESERQTILKSRVTRSDRDDLLELWRIRTEAYDTLKILERALVLRQAAQELRERVGDAGCLNGESS